MPAGVKVNFEFATANRILFGSGLINKIGPIAAELGSRAFVVLGSGSGAADNLVEKLEGSGVEVVTYPIDHEPDIRMVEDGVRLARGCDCQLTIGYGGGSAMDTAKAVAALATNPGEALDYLEVIGRGQPLTAAPLPVIAIPTTAGTGSEVTRNAVLGAPEKRVKVSMRSPLMLPRVALVDPQLTLSLPPDVTVSTGLDALTQLIEPFVSNQPNPLTDAICREGIRRASSAIRSVFYDGGKLPAREDMSLASLFGGIALANARLGAVHGFAAVIGGMYPAPHGAVCARLLPEVMSTNLKALRQREPESPVLGRYREVAQILTGDPGATAEDGVSWVINLCAELNFPNLGTYGTLQDDFPEIIAKAGQASSMKGNPIRLTEIELTGILARSF